MKKIASIFLVLLLAGLVFSAERGVYFTVYAGGFIPFQPDISDSWSETYLKMPYFYLIENKYREDFSTCYGIEVSYYFLKNSGIYISYDTENKSYDANYIGKFPNPISPDILRNLNVEDNIKFSIYETTLGFKHKFVDSRDLMGETSAGITVFHGTPTFMKNMEVVESLDHKSVLLKKIEFFDEHYNAVGIELGANLYKKILKGLMFGIFLKYNYGVFKIEKEERDDFNVPIQSFKFMISVKYGI